MCQIVAGFTVPPTDWSCASVATACCATGSCTGVNGLGCSGASIISIYVTSTKLVGTLSTYIGKLTKLFSITMTGTRTLAGTIPTEIGVLTQLTALQIYQTGMSGPIPTFLGNARSLNVLSLYNSHLSGIGYGVPSQLICS